MFKNSSEKPPAYPSSDTRDTNSARTELGVKRFAERISRLKEQLGEKNLLRLEPEEAEQFFVEYNLSKKLSKAASVLLWEYDRMEELVHRVWKLKNDASKGPKDLPEAEQEKLELSEDSNRRYIRYSPTRGQSLEVVYNKDNEDRSQNYGPRYELARLHFDLDELLQEFERSGGGSVITLIEKVLASERNVSRFLQDFWTKSEGTSE